MNLFQTSLYMFSSLLQADAAILGFGAVFIIFKIQSIENIRQNIIQKYHAQINVFGEMVNTLLGDNPEAIAKLLTKQGNAQYFRDFKYIACIPAKSREIGESIRFPIAVIASHAILSGALLYLSQFYFQCEILQNSLLVASFLWFAVGITLASRLAINLLTQSDSFPVSRLRPDVFEFVSNKDEKRWHDG
jgi:hypothetical protein